MTSNAIAPMMHIAIINIKAMTNRCTAVMPKKRLDLARRPTAEVVPAVDWNLASSSYIGLDAASSRRLSSMVTSFIKSISRTRSQADIPEAYYYGIVMRVTQAQTSIGFKPKQLADDGGLAS